MPLFQVQQPQLQEQPGGEEQPGVGLTWEGPQSPPLSSLLPDVPTQPPQGGPLPMPTGVAQPTEMELADEEQEEEGQEGQHAPPDFDDGPRPLHTGPLWLRLRFGLAGDADTNTGTDNC